MKDTYTINDLRNWRATTPPLRLGVLGAPVEHSLSPVMQNAALDAAGVEMRYGRFHVEPNELPKAFELIRSLDFVGVNLTTPHKVAALSLVDEVEREAARIGAINTVVRRDDKLIGYNTDGEGFSRAIREVFSVDLRVLPVLVLGAGGAGRAVAWRCLWEGCPQLVLVNRTVAKAEALACELGSEVVNVVPWDDAAIGARLGEVDLVVNATPIEIDRTNLWSLITASSRRKIMIYDLNYNSGSSVHSEAGVRLASGLTMLLHQGALSFQRWFSAPAPAAAMRAAVGLPRPMA